ncbi:MAG: IS1595 family transposase [Siculibacillus sp.]|nr:IS1595 family transposase [Siculibacillus sp.]
MMGEVHPFGVSPMKKQRKGRSFNQTKDYDAPSAFALDMDKLTEETAIEYFIRVRWSDNDGKPYCPKCGHQHVYRRKTRNSFVCANPECRHNFSPTSGTAFDNRKLSYKKIILAIHAFVDNSKGIAAVRMRNRIKMTNRNAFIFGHKLRELMVRDNENLAKEMPRLTGNIYVDGKWIGGHQRQPNEVANRKDLRKKENRWSDRKSIVSIVSDERTRVAVFETEAASVPWVKSNLAASAVVHLDEAFHWDGIGVLVETRRVNHKIKYSENGITTNPVESLNARYERSKIGIYHKLSGHTLYYATELAWRDDFNQHALLPMVDMMVSHALTGRRCRKWRSNHGQYLAISERRAEIEASRARRQAASIHT